MAKELIALAGDLVTERKRLSEGLRRLEGSLLKSNVSKELLRVLGASSAETILNEVDTLARSMDRLGALVKTLVQVVNHERLEDCEPLLADAVLTIEAKAMSLERPIVVDCKSNDVKADRETLHKFRPIFLEMLETLVEYCVETPKERFARKKRPKTYFQIDVKPFENTLRIMVLCDGNGILPPLASDHGLRLAEIGVRASFDGKPGQWSTWRFHIPTGVGAFHGIPVRVGERRLIIPSWAVIATRPLEGASPILGRTLALGEGLCRADVQIGSEASHGKWLVELSAGTQSVTYVVDEIFEPQEGFIKQLGEAFNGQGRFLGVVVAEAREQDVAQTGLREELCLVLNPAYLVYGGDEEQAPGAGGQRISVELNDAESESGGQHAV